MEQMKKLTDKITGVKKLRKDQLVVMILCGILLCVVALPVKQKDFPCNPDGLQGKPTRHGGKKAAQTVFRGCKYRF